MGPAELNTEEQLARLRLIRTENVGPITFRQLIGRFGSARIAIEALPELARKGGYRGAPKIPAVELAQSEMAEAERQGVRLIFLGTADYPSTLSAIDDAPPVFALKGGPEILLKPAIAIVGARNASANGKRFAERIARELGANGLIVVSGLARGIDSAAHIGALATGTVAVMAGGLDVIYPPENKDLYSSIIETGAAISEMPLGLKPQARHFPRRNRLVSGLTYGTLVVEAAPRSGSLITARLALEQGRDVYAVPGSPSDPRHRGTNSLIRGGAVLTETVDDILEALAGPLNRSFRDEGPEVDAQQFAVADTTLLASAGQARLLQELGPSPADIDEVVRRSGLTPAEVLTILLDLELAGRLDRHPGNKVSLAVSSSG